MVFSCITSNARASLDRAVSNEAAPETLSGTTRGIAYNPSRNRRTGNGGLTAITGSDVSVGMDDPGRSGGRSHGGRHLSLSEPLTARFYLVLARPSWGSGAFDPGLLSNSALVDTESTTRHVSEGRFGVRTPG